jgi:hypothetical protein
MHNTPGFWSSLFDFSFSTYVTPVIIKVLYVLAIILVLLVAVGMIIQGFNTSVDRGVVTLIIFAPLYFFVTVISIRIALEVVMVIFKIGESFARLAGKEHLEPLSAQETSDSSTNPPPSAPSGT